ncbi:pre-toxin TG domain-containing protein [Solibacillus cecembensis]|uniref:pre-toxin TG domain-containing protein n=1 Tax=Solibacillus cecembensis TaxID=459347 RepID=UPI003D00C52F
MGKKGKGKGFLGKAASFLGSIPSVGDVAKKAKKAVKSTAKKAGKAAKSTAKKAKSVAKSTAKKAKKAVKSTAKKAKKAASSAKKKVKKKAKQAKKKLGKVYTKARKTANNLSKSKMVKMVKQVKQVAKKAVLTTKKAAQKTKKAVTKAGQQVKAAVKDAKKVMKKVGGKIAHTYTAFKEGGYKSAASAILDFVPIVGNIKAGIEIATGKEMFTNRKLETWERGVGVAAVFGGGLVKGAVRGSRLASGIVTGSKNTPKNSTSVAKALDGKNIGTPSSINKKGLTSNQEQHYRQKIDEAKARGNQKAADDARYERYSKEKKNKDEKALDRKDWDTANERLRKNRERGRVEEIKGRKALEGHLNRELKDNNTNDVVTYTSSEGHVTRPDSIGRNTKGEIDLVHDHKHKTGGKDQTVHNDSQMRAEREMLEDKNGRHVVTISSDKPNINGVPPQPRPSGPLGTTSDVYYTNPENGKVTHVWESNHRLPGGGRWKKV